MAAFYDMLFYGRTLDGRGLVSLCRRLVGVGVLVIVARLVVARGFFFLLIVIIIVFLFIIIITTDVNLLLFSIFSIFFDSIINKGFTDGTFLSL